MQDSMLNRRQTIRVGAGVALAQVGIVGFGGQIELETLRLFGLPEAAPAELHACTSVPAGTCEFAAEVAWDPPSLTPGATSLLDVAVAGCWQGDLAQAALTSSTRLIGSTPPYGPPTRSGS
jgi:hypothetical protein